MRHWLQQASEAFSLFSNNGPALVDRLPQQQPPLQRRSMDSQLLGGPSSQFSSQPDGFSWLQQVSTDHLKCLKIAPRAQACAAAGGQDLEFVCSISPF